MSGLASFRAAKESEVSRLIRVAHVVLVEPQIRCPDRLPTCLWRRNMRILGVVKRPKESFSKGLSLRVFDEAYSPMQSDATCRDPVLP